MKKTVCMLLTCVIVLGLVFVMNACGSEEKKEIEIPEGYAVYENGDISFAYPEDWAKTDGSTVTLTAKNGNNVTVVYEDKNDEYAKMTTESYQSEMIPFYEQMGLTISNAKVEQTSTNGLAVTKVTHTLGMNGTKMEQTQYIVTVGERTYTITVTEVKSDDALVKNVFETLCEIK